MNVNIFDMDYTLITNDCDVSWKQYLVRHRLAPESDLAEADVYYEKYSRGELDFREFCRFQLREFAGRTPQEMAPLLHGHFEEFVRPRCRKAAMERIRTCRERGEICVILTSTNRAVAAPVGEFFGVDALCGSELEMSGGRYTGAPAGVFCLGEGKVVRGREIAERFGTTLDRCSAYGDSINDLPLLKASGEAHAITPSAALRQEAEAAHWIIEEWN